MKNFSLGLLTALCLSIAPDAATAQVVTTTPPIVQTDSKNIVVTFYADRGSGELQGQSPTAKLYAHTGVITSKSTSPSDWKHAPKWGDNSEKYELKYVSPNVWTLSIPDIDTYYGITEGETVEKLAFVFRNSTGSLTGKTAEGGDIFVNVLPAGFQMSLTEGSVITDATPVALKFFTTAPAKLSLYDGDKLIKGPVENATELAADYAFTSAGKHIITAEAVTSDGTTHTATSEFYRVASASELGYPGGKPMPGAIMQPDGTTLFCIAAPGKSSVCVIGSWNDYKIEDQSVMNYQDYEGRRYFWTSVSNLAKGKDYLYYYLVDGSIKVGDPYAHLVLDPNYDQYIPASVFPDMPAYPTEYVQGVPLAIFNTSLDDYDWQVKDFKGAPQDQLVVYELLIRDFTGDNGKASGKGTVRGVIDKIDYLKYLGVNAIELLPIMEFNGNNSWGYNTNFYMAPDKAYGTPDDYRELIDKCHEAGIAVILDIVFNQSDWLHPWYQMYSIDKNPFYNGSAPHSYSVLNDWNQDEPLVQRQWADALQYWMTAYKIDGFRFDLVKGLGDNDSYGNTYNPATNTWGTPNDGKTNAYNATRVARMAKLHEAMRAVNPDAYFINENLASAKEENEMAADGEINWANINNSSCQFAMGYQSDGSLNRFYAPKDGRTWGSTVSYAESHDEERMAYKQTKWGVDGVKGNVTMSMRRLGSVAAQMLMAPGSHMLWQFQEFGADQTTKNNDGGNNTNPKKVIWDYLYIPARMGLHNNYAELIRIRTENPSLFVEGVETNVNCSTWGGRSITLTNGAQSIAMLCNALVDKETTVEIGIPGTTADYQILSSSYETPYTLGETTVTLQPGAYIVLGSKDLSGLDPVSIEKEMTKVNVYSREGSIIVDGDARNVSVYTLSGINMGRRDNLAPGLYIVNVDGRGFKVKVD